MSALAWFLFGPAALLAAGLVAARLLARRGPDFACACLRAALTGSLVLPLVFGLVSLLHLRTVPLPAPRFLGQLGHGSAAESDELPSFLSLVTKEQNPAAPVAAMPLRPVSHAFQAGAWCLGAWGAGFLLLAVRLARAHLRVAAWRRRSFPAHPSVQRQADLLAERWGMRSPEVRISAVLSSPVLVGLRTHAILLPASAPEPTAEVLLHELAHARRGDAGWLLCSQVAVAVWFFNPLAWRAARLQEERAEEACDDWVVAQTGGAEGYARQLVELAEQQAWQRELALAGMPMASFRSALGRRVSRMLGGVAGARIGRGAGIGIGLAALLGVAALGFARPAASVEPVSLNPCVKIGAKVLPVGTIHIVYAGPHRSPDEKEILNRLDFREGDAYTPERVRRSLQVLYASGLFTNIRISWAEKEGKAEVAVVVAPVPTLSTIHVSGTTADEEAPLLRDMTAQPNLPYGDYAAYRDARWIEERLKKADSPAVRVEPQLETDPNQGTANLTFLVQPEEKK